jgi:trafficking protein particle complex subunit 9
MLISLRTTRIVLPVKKFLLPAEHVSQSIPTLSDRQFVVTKSNLTSAEEKNQRELFWYREELFKFIRGHWREVRVSRVVVVYPF